MIARIVIAFSLTSLLLTPAPSQGDVSPPPVPDARATEPEPLEKGKPVERALAVGEVHAYALKLDADQTVTVLLEKRGVAAVATVFAPNGMKVGIFGSSASSQGTEQIAFPAESAGNYRIDVRTFFRPSSPGHYLITLGDVHATTDQERIELARRSCEEKSWLDSENHFLVDAALESLSQCITAVGHRLKANHPQAVELVDKANEELKYLISRWRWGEFISPAYQESLTDYFKALASSAVEPDAQLSFATMKEVVEGLKVKADHCRKSNRGLGEEVKVTAVTKRGSVVVPGCAVYYKTCLHQYPKNNPPLRFPNASSPAHHMLVPDRYIMWAGEFGQPPPPQPDLVCFPVGVEPIDVPVLW
jgi:hypothetical protein